MKSIIFEIIQILTLLTCNPQMYNDKPKNISIILDGRFHKHRKGESPFSTILTYILVCI